MINNQINKIKSEIDLILIIGFFLITFGIIIHSFLLNSFRWGILFLIAGGVISSTIWFIIRKKKNLENYEQIINPKRLKVFKISFYSIYCLSLIVLFNRENIYQRPFWYFFLLSLLITMLYFLIFITPIVKKEIFCIFFKIVLLFLNLSLSQILLYPSILGIDNWFHQLFTLGIIEGSHITSIIPSYYQSFAIFHLLEAVTSIITGTGYKFSLICSVQFFHVVCVILFGYLLGKSCFSERVGLLTGLCILFSSLNIVYTFQVMPFIFGMDFIIMLIYLTSKVNSQYNPVFELLMIFFVLLLNLLHPLSSFYFTVSIIIFSLVWFFYYKIFNKIKIHTFNFKTILVFFAIFIVYWVYMAKSLIINIFSYFDVDPVKQMTSSGINNSLAYTISSTYIDDILLNYHYLFFGISFLGFLFMINDKKNRTKFFSIIIFLIVPIIIGFSGSLLNINLENQRWLYMSSVLLSIFFALSLLIIFTLTKSRFIVFFIIIFLFSYSLIIILTTSYDNQVIDGGQSIRYALTKSEYQAFTTLTTIWNHGYDVDSVMQLPLLFDNPEYYKKRVNEKFNIKNINEELLSKKFSDTPDQLIILAGKYNVNKRLQTNYGNLLLTYDPIDLMDNYRFSKIYNSHSVDGYRYLN